MEERKEPVDSGDKHSGEDGEAVSMHDLEMIFAPGKPPPSLHRGAEGLTPEAVENPPPTALAKEPPKPPRPPRKAASPPDIGRSDLATFAAMGGSIPPPAEAAPTNDAAANEPPLPPPPAEAAADATPVPDSKRIKARVLPRLRKPLPLPFPEPRADDEWKSPPDATLRDLKKLASSQPPRRKPVDSVDFDALLGMKDSGLSGSLSAPIVPPDLAKLLNDAPAEASGLEPSIPAPPRPKKKNNSDAIASAVTAHPSEPPRKKKRKNGPPSSRAPRPSAAEGVTKTTGKQSSLSPAATTKEEKPSRFALYAVLAAALLGGGYLLMRGGTPEPKQAEQTSPTTSPTEDPKPAQATPTSTAAAPVAVPVEPTPTAAATAIATVAAPLTGPMPHATTQAVATSAPTATPAVTAVTPAAKPPAGGGDFDRGAASAALGGVIGQAAGCKQSGDPSGVAHVQVTFAPSGHVTVANISGPPFAGTPTGGCIARAFKSATVPPFSGDPVTVSKTVQIP